MSKRIYPLTGIKYWYAYDVDDVCSLYKSQSLHPQTVRQWIKRGLLTVDSGKPSLIYGHDLRQFLGKHNNSNKCQTAFAEMFCVKCREAMPVLKNEIKVTHKNNFLHAQGHCRTCKTIMNKSYKMQDYPELRSFFRLVDVLELYDCDSSTANTHIHDAAPEAVTEPIQKELFTQYEQQ